MVALMEILGRIDDAKDYEEGQDTDVISEKVSLIDEADVKSEVPSIGDDDVVEKRYLIDGVGAFVAKLRGQNAEPPKQKERIVLDEHGKVIRLRKRRAHVSSQRNNNDFAEPGFEGRSHSTQQAGFGQMMMLSCDFPTLPTTDPDELRRIVRSKMVRCKVCGNRYGEVDLMERHLRDAHPRQYKTYVIEQEKINLQMMELDKQRTRCEEIMTGGFIPAQADIDAETIDVVPNEIPLPGEDSNGFVPRFNRFGGFDNPTAIVQRKLPYIKKRSPQCPFCDKRYRNQLSFRAHIAKKHPNCLEFVQCLVCFKCLPDKESLSPDAHDCDMTYLCLECQPARNMCTEDRLFKHRSKFHRGVNSGFKCNECNLKFLTPRKLRKHRKMSHVFTRTFQCHFCEELFISDTSLVVHERVHTGMMRFECTVCDHVSNRFICMEEHMKMYHGYVCSVCHEKIVTWNAFKDHMLEVHFGYITENSTHTFVESPRVWILYKGE